MSIQNHPPRRKYAPRCRSNCLAGLFLLPILFCLLSPAPMQNALAAPPQQTSCYSAVEVCIDAQMSFRYSGERRETRCVGADTSGVGLPLTWSGPSFSFTSGDRTVSGQLSSQQVFVESWRSYGDDRELSISGNFPLESPGKYKLVGSATQSVDVYYMDVDTSGGVSTPDKMTSFDAQSASIWVKFYGTCDLSRLEGGPSEGQIPTEISCSPTVRGLNPSKPGDVISPGATYYDELDRETGVIQERWFFNGVNTTSIVWDGKKVDVELQWTCLSDNKGYSKNFTIAAYQGASEPPAGNPPASNPPVENPPAANPPESQPGSGGGTQPPESAPGGLGPLGIVIGAGIAIGVAGVAGVAGIAIIKGILGRPPVPATPPAPSPQTPAPQPSSPPLQPPEPPKPPAPQPQPPQTPKPEAPPAPKPSTPPQPAKPQPRKLSPDEINQLRQRIDDLVNQRKRLKEEWVSTAEKITDLGITLKKNKIKFMIKMGLKTFETIQKGVDNFNPLDKVQDKIMETIFEKHDDSQDGKILIDQYNRLQELKKLKADLYKQSMDVGQQLNALKNQLASQS